MKKYLVGSVVAAILIETAWLIFLFVFVPSSDQQKEQEKCISKQVLQECEHAGAGVEEQLRRCDWALTRCAEMNLELREQKEGEKK